ncbi:sugar ABC transporter substrate-binding protein [Paeniglutamicibacter sp.]|uniref:sugar ABC transporter substrate-binding protein n=1 Tax=Paeniglutamicibacter sp. TaxID=1934391 RepID=UPI003989AC42
MHKKIWLAATLTALVLAAAGCSSPGTAQPTGQASGAGTNFATIADADFAGTSGKAPTTAVTTEPGQNVWILSCSQMSEGCATVSSAATEAAGLLGWKSTVYDGAFGAGGAYPTGVRQAIAAKADAIIVVSVDCNLIQAPLREAKRAGIPVVQAFSFDCDDPQVGGDALFTASMKMTEEHPDLAGWMQQWGAAKARWLMAETNGEARIINTVFDGKILGNHANKGFTEQLAECGNCEILEDVHVADSDIGSGVLRQKFSSALTANPTANATNALFDGWMSASGLAQAINSSGRSATIAAMGGEGLKPNMGFIKDGRGQSAAVAYDAQWLGWATVDVLARALAGAEQQIQGLGWQTVDVDHNTPEGESAYTSTYDFRADYRTAWNVK